MMYLLEHRRAKHLPGQDVVRVVEGKDLARYLTSRAIAGHLTGTVPVP